jgi:hypothetical protein
MKLLFSSIVCTILILILTTADIKAQKACRFAINEQRILANANLDTFLHLFKTDSFVIRNKKKYIPRFIKKELKCLAGGFRIANPGKTFNGGDVIQWNLPNRQLVFLARSQNVFVIQYRKGGFASSDHLVFILHNGKQIVDLWKGLFLVAVDLQSVKELNQYMSYITNDKVKFYKANIDF